MTLKQSGEKFVNFLFYIYLAILILFVSMKFTGDFHELWDSALRVRAIRRDGVWNANLELFKTIKTYWRLIHSSNKVYLKNLVGNIIPFVPMGMFEAYRHTRKSRIITFFTSMLRCLGIIVVIEVVQLFTCLGYFDVDDILLNIIGYIIYEMLKPD